MPSTSGWIRTLCRAHCGVTHHTKRQGKNQQKQKSRGCCRDQHRPPPFFQREEFPLPVRTGFSRWMNGTSRYREALRRATVACALRILIISRWAGPMKSGSLLSNDRVPTQPSSSGKGTASKPRMQSHGEVSELGFRLLPGVFEMDTVPGEEQTASYDKDAPSRRSCRRSRVGILRVDSRPAGDGSDLEPLAFLESDDRKVLWNRRANPVTTSRPAPG